jgi:hypothetical protein
MAEEMSAGARKRIEKHGRKMLEVIPTDWVKVSDIASTCGVREWGSRYQARMWLIENGLTEERAISESDFEVRRIK